MSNSTVSVVIATLGGDALRDTINSLNAGSVVPEEILVCVPEREAALVELPNEENVQIVATSVRGQVAQRAVGFRQAKSEFVLQLDDDMIVSEGCLQILMSEVDGRKRAVAPLLISKSTNIPFYSAPANTSWRSFYYWLLNGEDGYRPGTLTLAGTNIGVDPEMVSEKSIIVDWVPGGCLMHRNEHLELSNFYPLSGKAYSEDLIHSTCLIHAGVELRVSTEAICYVDAPERQNFGGTISEFKGFFFADYKARLIVVKRNNLSLFRMNIYYFVLGLRFLKTKLLG